MVKSEERAELRRRLREKIHSKKETRRGSGGVAGGTVETALGDSSTKRNMLQSLIPEHPELVDLAMKRPHDIAKLLSTLVGETSAKESEDSDEEAPPPRG